jgi:hypothetical protein
MKNWFKRLSDRAASQPKSREETFDRMYAGALPKIREFPVRPPETADENLKQFYSETEWLQPVLNRLACPEGFRFNEVDTPYVTLDTFDGPAYGRTFELSCGSVVVGKIAVVPNYFRLSDENDWADLRMRLNYPIEMVDGKTVHGLLTSLIRLTQEFENDTYEGVCDDPRASARASQAIVEAMWDRMNEPSSAALIEMSVSGPWTRFKSYINHWKKNGIDPWEKWERKRED